MKKSTTPEKLAQIRLGVKLANIDIKLDNLEFYAEDLELDETKVYKLRTELLILKHKLMNGKEETSLVRKAYFKRSQKHFDRQSYKEMIELYSKTPDTN